MLEQSIPRWISYCVEQLNVKMFYPCNEQEHKKPSALFTFRSIFNVFASFSRMCIFVLFSLCIYCLSLFWIILLNHRNRWHFFPFALSTVSTISLVCLDTCSKIGCNNSEHHDIRTKSCYFFYIYIFRPFWSTSFVAMSWIELVLCYFLLFSFSSSSCCRLLYISESELR